MVTVHSSTDDPAGTGNGHKDPVKTESRAAKAKAKAKAKVLTLIEQEEARLQELAEEGDAESQFILGLYCLDRATGAEPRFPHLEAQKREQDAAAAAAAAAATAADPSSSSSDTTTSNTTDGDAADDPQARAQAVIRDIRQQQRDNNKLRRKAARARRDAGQPLNFRENLLSVSAADQRAGKLRKDGVRWLLQAHHGGHAKATIALANQLVNLAQSAEDDEDDAAEDQGQAAAARDSNPLRQAMALYESVAGSHPDACFNLGKLHYEGSPRHGVLSDRRASVDWFLRAAEMDDPAAQYWLGYLYHVGDAAAQVEPDMGRALELLEAAATAGHGEAAMYLCTLHRAGDDALNLAPSGDAMWKYLRLAEAAGSAEALFMLADVHFHGTDGVGVDAPKALRYYLEAGELSHSAALCSAAAMHFQGLGTARDLKRAYQLYQLAVDADSGNLDAWRNLASCYYHGHGVPQDRSLAKTILETVLRPAMEQEAERT